MDVALRAGACIETVNGSAIMSTAIQVAIQVGQLVVAALGGMNWTQIVGDKFSSIATSIIHFIQALLGFAQAKTSVAVPATA